MPAGLFSRADESLKDETRLLLLWVGSLLTLHTFVLTRVTSVVKPLHTFMVRSRVSKSCLKAELCFHRYVHFSYVPIMFSAFTITSVLAIRRTSLLRSSLLSCLLALFSSTDESLKNETCLLLLWVGYWHCKLLCSPMKQPVHTFMARSRVSKNCIKAELCFHCYVHFACVLIYDIHMKYIYV